MFNANAHEPAGLLFLAIDHLAQQPIVIVIDLYQRGVSQRPVEPNSVAGADVSDLTVKNLASCFQHDHSGGSIYLVALILSLIRLTIQRDWRIRDDGLQAHDDIRRFRWKYYRSGVLIALRRLP